MSGDHDSLVGSILEGRYQVECEIGRGAMGVVYRARHVKVGRKVAIKVLHRRLLETPNMVERFEREANAAAKLIHHNLVGVLDLVELPDGRRMMVLEYASGKSLAQLVGPGAPMDPERAVALLRGVCDGLDEAHRVGLVHRDLKPENVVVEIDVDGTEVPRIIDFGIAILRESAHDDAPRMDAPAAKSTARLTELGTVVGTPAYMAPEQALGEVLDQRCDLFALGVMAFEMLTGEVPFEGTGVEIVQQTVSRPIPMMAERAPAGWAIDPRLEVIVRKLTARRPHDRFASAREVRQALDALAFDLPRAAAVVALRAQTFSEPTTLGGAVASVDTSQSTPIVAGPPRTRSGRGFTALALGICIGGVIVGATAIAMRADRDDKLAATAPTTPDISQPDVRHSDVHPADVHHSDSDIHPSDTKPGSDAPKPDGRKSDGQKPDGQKPDGQKPDGQKPDGQKPDAQKPDGQKPDGQKPDGTTNRQQGTTVKTKAPVERDTSAAAVTARYREVGRLVNVHADRTAAVAQFRRIDLMSSLASIEARTAALDALDAVAADLVR